MEYQEFFVHILDVHDRSANNTSVTVQNDLYEVVVLEQETRPRSENLESRESEIHFPLTVILAEYIQWKDDVLLATKRTHSDSERPSFPAGECEPDGAQVQRKRDGARVRSSPLRRQRWRTASNFERFLGHAPNAVVCRDDVGYPDLEQCAFKHPSLRSMAPSSLPPDGRSGRVVCYACERHLRVRFRHVAPAERRFRRLVLTQTNPCTARCPRGSDPCRSSTSLGSRRWPRMVSAPARDTGVQECASVAIQKKKNRPKRLQKFQVSVSCLSKELDASIPGQR